MSTEMKGLLLRDKVLVFVAFLLWLVLFAGGVCVNSEPYRQAISGAETTINPLLAWLAVLTIYTPTNVALLAVLAGLLGALGAHARLHRRRGVLQAAGQETTEERQEEPPPWLDTVNPYLSALLRGFFAYLAIISGVLILIEDPFASPTPEQYIRLAGFVSILSFVVNYDPRIFGRLINLISEKIEERATKPAGKM